MYRDIGQHPIVLRREVPGFVLNRLQAALLAEAFRLVRDGVASPSDVDACIAQGLGPRWSFMGPFETISLNAPGGIPDYVHRFRDFLTSTLDEPLGPDVFNDESVATVMRQWPQHIDRIGAMATRDKRLAELRGAPRREA